MRLSPATPSNITSSTTHCSAPSKLILSGEHAVLYGCPALSMAIGLSTHCTLTNASPQNATPATFDIHLEDFELQSSFDFSEWQQQALQIEQCFQQFKQNARPINQVLTSPFDLILITLWTFHKAHPITEQNWQLHIHSEVPIGRGLGSSAGVIVSLLAGLFRAHQKTVSDKQLLDLAKRIESYQHGSSSGLDPATLIHAGLLKYQISEPIQTLPSAPLTAWLIDTGAPQSHTGECVQAVKEQHQNNHAIWQRFKKVSLEIEQAWLTQTNKSLSLGSIEPLKQAIQANQKLLVEIGVVPNKVEGFIQQLDQTLNAASKVCGAGSIAGDHAGMVLCLSEHPPTELCKQYDYPFWPLKLQTQGVHCVLD